MDNKESYTPKEVEEMALAIDSYKNIYQNYYIALGLIPFSKKEKKDVKEKLNKSVEDCNAKLPKSLIDKLGIKKVE